MKQAIVLRIVSALFVRLLLSVHSVLAYWRVVSVYGQTLYWFLLLLLLIPFGETIYIIIRKQWEEKPRFCVCFACYLLSTIPAICLLEMNRLDRYTEIYQSQNETFESLIPIEGVTLPVTLVPDIWVSVIEQGMLFLMVLARLMLPRGKLSRDQLSQLLFVYIGLASDTSELFVLFDETPIRQDRSLTIGIFVVWSVSMMLFTMGLTANESSKQEVYSILLTFILQDCPFLCVRLYAVIRYTLITYSILFFTFKNVFVTILLLYRVIVLCYEYKKASKSLSVN